MNDKKQNSYIEGVNATENAYDDIINNAKELRSVLDMSYTDISSAIFYLKEIADISNKTVSILSNTEEL